MQVLGAAARCQPMLLLLLGHAKGSIFFADLPVGGGGGGGGAPPGLTHSR